MCSQMLSLLKSVLRRVLMKVFAVLSVWTMLVFGGARAKVSVSLLVLIFWLFCEFGLLVSGFLSSFHCKY